MTGNKCIERSFIWNLKGIPEKSNTETLEMCATGDVQNKMGEENLQQSNAMTC